MEEKKILCPSCHQTKFHIIEITVNLKLIHIVMQCTNKSCAEKFIFRQNKEIAIKNTKEKEES